MKKAFIFILLTVLILGAFTACNGEVDNLLWNGESGGGEDPVGPTETKFIFRLTADSISDGVRIMVGGNPEEQIEFEIPEGVKKWNEVTDGDLTQITIKVGAAEPVVLLYTIDGDYVDYELGDTYLYPYRDEAETQWVESWSDIIPGRTYYLSYENWV